VNRGVYMFFSLARRAQRVESRNLFMFSYPYARTTSLGRTFAVPAKAALLYIIAVLPAGFLHAQILPPQTQLPPPAPINSPVVPFTGPQLPTPGALPPEPTVITPGSSSAPTLPVAPAPAPVDASSSGSSTDDEILQPFVEYVPAESGKPQSIGEAILDQMLSDAATQSPTMREQQYTMDMSTAARFRSWLSNLPTINATYNVGMFYDLSNSSGSSALKPGGATTIQANYPLFYWGGYKATKDLAQLRERIAQNGAVIAYAKLCLQLRQDYYMLIVQKAQVSLLQRQLETAQHQLEKERILLGQGRSTNGQVNKLDLDYSNHQIQMDDASNLFQQKITEFRRLSGVHDFGADKIPDVIPVHVVNTSALQTQYQDFSKKGFNDSPTARDSAMRVDAVNQEIIINNSKLKPLLDATVGLTQSPYQNSNNNGIQFTNILFAGVSGTWNIFDRLETRDANLALLAKRRLFQAQSADARNEILDNANDSLSQINIGLRAIELLKKQLAQFQDDYRMEKEKAALGRTEQIELDLARDAVLNARYQILTRQAQVANGYYAFCTDLFCDPAMANVAPLASNP